MKAFSETVRDPLLRLMCEQTRYIVFFINWMAYQQMQAGHGAAWRRAPASVKFYTRALWRMICTARTAGPARQGEDFFATQVSAFLKDFTFQCFLEDCYAENARRMGMVEAGLLRPRLLPRRAEVALASSRLWQSKRRPA